jgi:hypothetical protein
MTSRLHTRFFNFLLSIASCIPLVLVSGCVSSRTLFEDLAKTPHEPVQDTERYKSLNSFQQDFLYLTETVRETHPDPYAAWSKEEFDAEQNRILESLAAETSRVVFEQDLQAFLSRLKDSHTGAMTSSTGGERQYPVSYFWIKDTLILASVPREEDTTLIGSHVLAFNGIPTTEVLTRFTRFIAAENIYQARRTLQYYFVFPTYQREAGVIQSDTLELNLLTRAGNTQTFCILPVEQPKRVYHYDENPITTRVKDPFTYKILKDRKACYLQWNTMFDIRVLSRLSFPTNLLAYPVFWFMGVGHFESFLEDMFEEMKEEGVNALVVDLRNNGGGSSVYGEMLLYHLNVPSDIRSFSMAIRFSPLYREFFPDIYRFYASQYAERYGGKALPDSLIVTSSFVKQDSAEATFFGSVRDESSTYYIEPERTVFKGNAYFLVGEGTFSSAILLSTIVGDNKLFPLVGQPTRGRPSHYGETLVLKLPNTGVICRISCKKFFRPDTSRDAEDALFPDVEIWPTFEDIRCGRDPVLEWVLRDAEEKTVSLR